MVTEKPAGGPGIGAQMCIDAATDSDLMDFGLKMSKDSCKRYDVKRAGAAWVIDAECTFGPVKSTTKTTISGDFQSSVTVRIEGTTGRHPGRRERPAADAHHADGDVGGRAAPTACGLATSSLGGGIRMNVKQVKKLQKLLPKVQIK